MKGTTYQHTLTGEWDNIVVSYNGAKDTFSSASVFFDEDIIIRGKKGQDEINITSDMSPMEISGMAYTSFPYEIKGQVGGIIKIITII